MLVFLPSADRKESELDESFWQTAVEVTTLDLDDVDCMTDAFSLSSSVPLLMQGTLPKICTAGKSMEMLSKLGKLSLAIGRNTLLLPHSVLFDTDFISFWFTSKVVTGL